MAHELLAHFRPTKSRVFFTNFTLKRKKEEEKKTNPIDREEKTRGMKRAKGITWTEEETINLIEAYKEKWYSVKRGPLKASQWEEVAVTVTLRCGYEHDHPSEKTGMQCRHKMEKLRKRYRAQKRRGVGGRSWWPYYHHLETMEGGPMPVSARPLLNEEEEEEEEEVGVRVAEEIREFARRLVKIEKRKLNVMRQTEKSRIHMENKRIQMILDSRTKILDTIAATFAPH